jgi:hypothetical protein
LLIARTSILDIKVKGNTRGIGLDIVYQQLADFLLRHHNRRLRETARGDFAQVFNNDLDEPIAFLATTEFLLTQLDANEKQDLRDQLDLILHDNQPADVLCMSLYQLIREMADSDDAANTIEARRSSLAKNPGQAQSLRTRLPWIYN